MTVKAVVHQAPEGGYWAEMPAMPGWVTQGDSLGEIRENLKEAVAGWLEAGESEIAAKTRFWNSPWGRLRRSSGRDSSASRLDTQPLLFFPVELNLRSLKGSYWSRCLLLLGALALFFCLPDFVGSRSGGGFQIVVGAIMLAMIGISVRFRPRHLRITGFKDVLRVEPSGQVGILLPRAKIVSATFVQRGHALGQPLYWLAVSVSGRIHYFGPVFGAHEVLVAANREIDTWIEGSQTE